MTFTAKVHSGNLTTQAYPVLVVPAFEEGGLTTELRELDKHWKGILATAMKAEVLTDEGEIYIAPSPLPRGIRRVAFVGCGKVEEFNLEAVRRMAGKAANALRKRQISRIVFLVEAFMPIDGNPENTGMALIEGARLGSYIFDRFKNEKDTHILESAELHYPKGTDTKKLVPILDETLALTTSTLLTRDWANTPSNLATPTHLAKLAQDIAKEASLTVKVLEEKECRKLGMGSFLAVAKGSDEPPKFIILDYKPRRHKKTVCLVGKAVTFDSGGISLKPGKDMHVMKGDMGGGIAVLATMRAVGMLKPEGVRVVGIVPACENMPSGRAQKPGDIMRTMSGKSIEVLNTDAEGRMILADGLEYGVKEYAPDAIVDVATLTGACVIALGDDIAGIWTDDDGIADAIIEAGEVTGEPVWRMPLHKAYNRHLKSDFADMRNIGKREGGAITAALFLGKFTSDVPWMHVDIAGPFWNEEGKAYISKGATGYGPRLLYRFIENWVGK